MVLPSPQTENVGALRTTRIPRGQTDEELCIHASRGNIVIFQISHLGSYEPNTSMVVPSLPTHLSPLLYSGPLSAHQQGVGVEGLSSGAGLPT